MVGEACAYVQGESLKVQAVFLVRLTNSPVTRLEGDFMRIWLVLGVVAGTNAMAGDVNFDQHAADQKAQFERLEAGTIDCINKTQRALLRRGRRDRDTLIKQPLHMCANDEYQYLIKQGKSDQTMAMQYLEFQSSKQLDEVLKDGRN